MLEIFFKKIHISTSIFLISSVVYLTSYFNNYYIQAQTLNPNNTFTTEQEMQDLKGQETPETSLNSASIVCTNTLPAECWMVASNDSIVEMKIENQKYQRKTDVLKLSKRVRT